MRRWLGLGIVLALAACEPADPLARDRAACAEAGRASDERVAACTRLIESGELDDAARAEMQALRGDAHHSADAVTPALRDYEAALRLNENNARALQGRAGILLASGQLDAAELLLDRLIASGEASGDAMRMRGDIALQRAAYTDAIEHYDDALAADGRLALAYAHRARAKERLRDVEGARTDYTEAIRIDGALAEARAGRCWLNVMHEGDIATMRRRRWQLTRRTCRRSCAAACCNCAEKNGRTRKPRLKRRWRWSLAIRRRCSGAASLVAAAATATGART